MIRSRIINDDLNLMSFVGEVVDNKDPLKLGRIKVKVFGKFDDLETVDIPFASPSWGVTAGSSNGSGFFSIPKIGSKVNVMFDNGNLYYPIYLNHQEISQELLEQISDDDYLNAHSIIYDSEVLLKLWYLPSKGLLLELDKSFINIKADNTIVLSANDGKKIHIQKDNISIGKENISDEPAVLGDKNVKALNDILDRIDSICDKLIQYGTTQSSATSAVFVLSPLAPALTKLVSDISAIKVSLTPIKQVSIPQTRSNSVTIDGPSKV